MRLTIEQSTGPLAGIYRLSYDVALDEVVALATEAQRLDDSGALTDEGTEVGAQIARYQHVAVVRIPYTHRRKYAEAQELRVCYGRGLGHALREAGYPTLAEAFLRRFR
jgi:hypothetical protein